MGKKLSLEERRIYRMAFRHALQGAPVDLMHFTWEIENKMGSFSTYELEIMAGVIEANWKIEQEYRQATMTAAEMVDAELLFDRQCRLHTLLAIELGKRMDVFEKERACKAVMGKITLQLVETDNKWEKELWLMLGDWMCEEVEAALGHVLPTDLYEEAKQAAEKATEEEKSAEAEKPAKRPPQLVEKVCAICGKTFAGRRGKNKYCSAECRKEVARRRAEERKAKHPGKEDEEMSAREAKEAQRRASLAHLGKLNREAKAAGLSYGQYMAQKREAAGE